MNIDPVQFDPNGEVEEPEEVVGFLGTPDHSAAPANPTDTRPAGVRIRELFTAMPSHRTILVDTLRFCEQPQPLATVNTFIDGLLENSVSVYGSANLCTLLERAGALLRVTDEGEPAEKIEAEPEVVEVDGIEYFAPKPAPSGLWVTTEEGRTYIEGLRPQERMLEILEADAIYKSIYTRVLELCSVEGGATTPDLGDAIDDDPLLQEPRYYVQYFVGKLEECGALAWKQTWVITEIGQAGLRILKDMASADDNTETNEKA